VLRMLAQLGRCLPNSRHLVLRRTIGSPSLQPNACANAGMFERDYFMGMPQTGASTCAPSAQLPGDGGPRTPRAASMAALNIPAFAQAFAARKATRWCRRRTRCRRYLVNTARAWPACAARWPARPGVFHAVLARVADSTRSIQRTKNCASSAERMAGCRRARRWGSSMRTGRDRAPASLHGHCTRAGRYQPLAATGIETVSVALIRSPRTAIVATTFPFPMTSRWSIGTFERNRTRAVRR